MNKQPTGTHYLLLLGIALIWGSQYIFNQIAVQQLPPLTLAAGRAGLGAMTLALIGLFMPEERRRCATQARKQWGTYLQLAFFEALLPMYLISWGQSRIESSIAAILMGTIPIFTLLLAPMIVGGKHWRPTTIASVISGFIGIVVLVGPSLHGGASNSLIGECAILGAAASVSISLLLFSRLGETSPVISVRNILGIATVPLIILSCVFEQPWNLYVDLSTLEALAILGVFCAGLVYLMFARLIQLAGSVFTSLTNYLCPLVGVLLGALVAGEAVGLNAWLALVLIAAALVINQPKLLLRLFKSKPN